MKPRWPVIIALAGVAAWLTIAVITWAGATPLGHDESQYAIAARDAIAGEEPRWFYLSRGMNALSIPGMWLGGTERTLRLMPTLFGIGFLLATWMLARRTIGALGAAWAIVVLATTRNVVRMSTDLLSDMPAAACLIAALAVIVDEVDRDTGPRWRIMLAAPLLAAALYIRYGSAVPIAVIVGGAILVGARTLARRPMPVIATAGLFLLLLVPHFVQAIQLTGSPLGILLASRGVPQQAWWGDGLETYLTSNPFRYYGTLCSFVLLAGVTAVRIRERRHLLVWLVAIGAFVAMGVTTHGMLRYILVPVALFVVLGTDQLRRLADRTPRRVRIALAVAAAVVCGTTWFLISRRQFTADDYRANRMRGTLTAAPLIRTDAAGAKCIVIGTHSPQLEWYSGCLAPLVLDDGAVAQAHNRGERAYVVRDHTPSWAPSPQPELARYPGAPTILLVLPEIEVARIDPR